MAALAALEADRAGRPTQYWFGDRIDHADIAVACALRHMVDAMPALIEQERFPHVFAHAARLEELEAFKAVSQPFIPPS